MKSRESKQEASAAESNVSRPSRTLMQIPFEHLPAEIKQYFTKIILAADKSLADLSSDAQVGEISKQWAALSAQKQQETLTIYANLQTRNFFKSSADQASSSSEASSHESKLSRPSVITQRK